MGLEKILGQKEIVQDCTTEAIERLEDCIRYLLECLQFSCDMLEI